MQVKIRGSFNMFPTFDITKPLKGVTLQKHFFKEWIIMLYLSIITVNVLSLSSQLYNIEIVEN